MTPTRSGAGRRKRKRRWLQFSLRTLLLATALFALWLGLTVDRVRRQKRAVDKVLALGGWVHYGYQADDSGILWPQPKRYQVEPYGPPWLLRWLGPEYFNTPVAVNLSLTEVTDEDLQCLEGLPKLKSLGLEKTAIGNAGLAHVKGLRNLRHLYLDRTNVDDAGLEHIAQLPQLESLQLGDRITDAGLAYLRGLSGLKSLDLGGQGVTDAGMAHLRGLTDVERLSLYRTQITDDGLRHLASLRKLKSLDARQTRVTSAGVAWLRRELPALKRVMIDRPKNRMGARIVLRVPQRESTRLGVELKEKPCVVVNIHPNSPASRGNVRTRDTILTIDGKAVTSASEVVDVVDRKGLGAKLTIELLRGTEAIRSEVVLDGFDIR